jgi:hypothetical protein
MIFVRVYSASRKRAIRVVPPQTKERCDVSTLKADLDVSGLGLCAFCQLKG